MKTEDVAALGESLYSLGYTMLEAGRLLDASEMFRAMVLICSRDERGWLGLGRCLERTNQLQAAIDVYSLATLAIPATVRTRVALARALRERGDDVNAEVVLAKAAELAEAANDEGLTEMLEKESLS